MASSTWSLDWRSLIFHLLDESLKFAGRSTSFLDHALIGNPSLTATEKPRQHGIRDIAVSRRCMFYFAVNWSSSATHPKLLPIEHMDKMGFRSVVAYDIYP